MQTLTANYRGEELPLLQAVYLEYVNEFISVQGFADHYGITDVKAAQLLIEQARAFHEKQVELLKGDA